MEVVGILKNARRVKPGEDQRAPCLRGAVYGDTKGRFRDGDVVTTSTIMKELPGGVFKTRFSAYRVESWDGESKPANDNTYTSLRAANKARQNAWIADSGNVPDLSFSGNELAGEVGEACNVIKKLERERLGWRGSRDTVEHLADELADVVICADLIAISAGLDLEAAVRAKFNATSEKQGFPHRMVSA